MRRNRPPIVWTLRLVVATVGLPLAGCATSLTIERISPSRPQSDYVARVTSAYREPSGAVVLCVVGQPAQTPFPFGHSDREFSLKIPKDAPVKVPQSVRKEIPRFQIAAANIGPVCPRKIDPAMSVPVRRIDSNQTKFRDDFDPTYDEFMSLLGPGTEGAAVWTVYVGYARVFYVSELPRFEGRRAVEISTGEREVEGQPAYLALLPFAVVYDVLMLPVYALMALAGIPGD